MKFNNEDFFFTGIGSIHATKNRKKIIYTDLIGKGGLVLLTSNSPIKISLNPKGSWEFRENEENEEH